MTFSLKLFQPISIIYILILFVLYTFVLISPINNFIKFLSFSFYYSLDTFRIYVANS